MASTKKPLKKSKSKLTPRKKKSSSWSKSGLSVLSKNSGRLKALLSPYIFSAFSILLILAGAALIFMASTSSLNLDWKHPYIEKVQTAGKAAKVSQKPATLYIPKLNRVLNVSDGEVVNNRWTISQTGVSYLKTTPAPGSKGNSVLYGHNLKNILGDLYLLQNGDSIYVVAQSGEFVKYQVFETKEVTPDSIEILDNANDSRLTVYTCSGFLDTARFVVVARQTNYI